MTILQILFVLLIFGSCLMFYHQYYNVNQRTSDDVVEKFTETENIKITKIKKKMLRIKYDIERIYKQLNLSIMVLDSLSLESPYDAKDVNMKKKVEDDDDDDDKEKDDDDKEKDDDDKEKDDDDKKKVEDDKEKDDDDDDDYNGNSKVSDPSGSEVDDQESNDNDKADKVVNIQETIKESFTNFVDKPRKNYKTQKNNEDTFQVQGISCGLTANCYQY